MRLFGPIICTCIFPFKSRLHYWFTIDGKSVLHHPLYYTTRWNQEEITKTLLTFQIFFWYSTALSHTNPNPGWTWVLPRTFRASWNSHAVASLQMQRPGWDWNDPLGLGQSGSASQNNHNALPQTSLAAVSPCLPSCTWAAGSPIEIRSDPVCSHPSEGSGIRERIGQAGERMVWKAKKATNWP